MRACERGCDVTIREGVNSTCPRCSGRIVEVNEAIGASCPYCGSKNFKHDHEQYTCNKCGRSWTDWRKR